EHGRLRALWWVRAGLVDPAVPARTVAGILGEFPTGECQAVSQESVGRVRDALCNIILGINQSEIRALAASACDDGTFIMHRVRDECSTRLRSYSASAHAGAGLPVRGPASKIQNNVITIYGPGESGHVNALTELQPLGRKDDPTLATAVIGAIRCLHVLVGDGVNTNQHVCKRVSFHFTEDARRNGYTYLLVEFVCGSHVGNLCVLVSVCARRCKDPVENDALCANASRYFRHLVPAYVEEYASTLRDWVRADLDMVIEAAIPAEVAASRDALRALCGDLVLPPAILRLLNRRIGALEHSAPAGVDRGAVAGGACAELYKFAAVVDEHPAHTRFFTFAICIHTLLGMKLLGAPSR
ncbi:unnamed protein product, partial [Prorocentrum cordatum]